ncbi:MAG: hypothetical protein AB7E42_02815 [Anaerotignaceae bacterium]
MTNLSSLYACYVLSACIALITLFSSFLFRYRTFKETKAANVVHNMSRLQYKYYTALANGEFSKYPEIKKQIEKTLNVYSAIIKNNDYNFKEVLIVRKKKVNYKDIIMSELFKEFHKISKTTGSLNEIMKLDNQIREELMLLKKPIQCRLWLIFQNMFLHILRLIACVAGKFENKPKNHIHKHINEIDEYRGNFYDVAHA